MRRMMSVMVCLLSAAGIARAADTVIVCPAAMQPALKPWVEHRAAQGRTFAWTSDVATPQRIRTFIRAQAAGGELKSVVLVGDVDGPSRALLGKSQLTVPTYYAPAKVGLRYGSEPVIATDNWYADLDDDGVPDVSIGRLPADTAEELATMARRIIEYENDVNFGRWRQRVNLVAGFSGFGFLLDSAIELVATRLIAERIPAPYATTMTYGNWRSPFCPDPRDFRTATVERLTEGCLAWVYLGHAQPQGLDRVSAPGGVYPILETRDMPLVTRLAALGLQAKAPTGPVQNIGTRSSAPVAFLLSCYTGAFDAEDCLAEELLRTEGGPVAVVSGSRVTMPYAMAVLGTELLSECFEQRRGTLGETLLHAKRNSMLARPGDATRQLVDNLAKLLSPGDADLHAERAEHLLLFNLLGDPLLRLHHPREAQLEVRGTPVAGGELIIDGRSPVDGNATVELVVRRDRLTFTPPARQTFDHSLAGREEFRRVYQQANDPRLCSQQTHVEEGKFQARLEIPQSASGACHVRVFVEGRDDFAVGAVDVQVQPRDKAVTAAANKSTVR